MKLLVIIVTYNAIQWVERCFCSLETSSVRNDVFVVDNGSTDGTQVFIKKNYPSVIFKQSEINLGFGRANNIGLQYALDNHYDYVYLLNQDAWVMPDTFEKLINIQKEKTEFGILSPMQLQGNSYYFDSKFKNLSLNRINKYILDDFYFNRINSVYEIDFVMAAHWLISADCLKTVGGFSPTFYHYGEDNNYLHRAKFYKYKIGIVPAAHSIHDRADRKSSKIKLMYTNYTKWLVRISNPLNSKNHYEFEIIQNTIFQLYKYKSFVPIKYCYKLLRNYKKIISNKQKSIQDSNAFLNI